MTPFFAARSPLAALPLFALLAGTAPSPLSAAECTASGDSLGAAKAAYGERCPTIPRVDCDPIGGGWTCSSERIGRGAPGLATIARPSPVEPPPVDPPPREPVPAEPAPVPSEPPRGGGACEASGATLGAAKERYAQRCSAPRVDCDPDGGEWTCASYRIGLGAPTAGAPPPPAEPAPAEPAPVTPAPEEPTPAVLVPEPDGGSGGALGPNDLLSLHWDSFPDIDDLQAMIAAREILDDNPVARLLSVAGTVRRSFDRVRPGTDEINVALYGADAVNALDPGTLSTVVARWQATLEAGGTVHVAEGGPSDFTARVLRELAGRGVGGLKRVRVVQHSVSANERNTTPADIADVRRLATYVTIDDGNSLNGTPGFLERDNTAAARFRQRARASAYGPQWDRAFAVARDNGRDVVDFSDAVEVMAILGLPTSVAPDPRAFAERYF